MAASPAVNIMVAYSKKYDGYAMLVALGSIPAPFVKLDANGCIGGLVRVIGVAGVCTIPFAAPCAPGMGVYRGGGRGGIQ